MCSLDLHGRGGKPANSSLDLHGRGEEPTATCRLDLYGRGEKPRNRKGCGYNFGVVLQTGIGGERVVDMISGEQLPRIC